MPEITRWQKRECVLLGAPAGRINDGMTNPGIGSLEADRQTLQALANAGANLTKPTEVNAYLYFQQREAADRAAIQVATPEMSAVVRRAADDSGWLCFVTGTMVPSETAIRALSVRLKAVADTLGGEYDGWEAAVTT